ncbi:MAG: YebC/PmpR family DNA-binding transcriptional regulator [Elusimicrobia bacterium]|nr:YebC/PmpR family DNA-binding transcriptional regulator [Elusimicrobiota bacterium]
MGGHSHWAGIKHKKAIVDAKRGKIFTKIVKEISIAARMGGGDTAGNARLRKAIDDAKAANMPIENIKRAVMKGTGQIPGVIYEEITYEGYGPCGIAVLVETTTDSKNRTFSEIRKLFEKSGGNIGTAGCVAWMFEKKGYIQIEKGDIKEDELMAFAIDLGAHDFKVSEESYEVITSPEDFDTIKTKLSEKKFQISSSEITMLPKNEVKVGEEKAGQVINMMEAFEDHDDVKEVYSNFNIPDEILAKLDQ